MHGISSWNFAFSVCFLQPLSSLRQTKESPWKLLKEKTFIVPTLMEVKYLPRSIQRMNFDSPLMQTLLGVKWVIKCHTIPPHDSTNCQFSLSNYRCYHLAADFWPKTMRVVKPKLSHERIFQHFLLYPEGCFCLHHLEISCRFDNSLPISDSW